jgi:hypothetical protein
VGGVAKLKGRVWMDGWRLVEEEEMVDLHLDDEDDMMREGRESRLVGWGEVRVESTLIDD